jgi:hypothetical protein
MSRGEKARLVITVSLWCLISAIPAAILALCIEGLLERGGDPKFFVATGAIAGLVAMTVYVVVDNVGRAGWRSRWGRACTQCGYDSPDPQATCPECGEPCACVSSYRGPSRATVLWQVAWVLGVIVVLGVWLRLKT